LREISSAEAMNWPPVVDEDVDAPEALERSVDESRHLLGLADIGG
jgi:hypothetical protein